MLSHDACSTLRERGCWVGLLPIEVVTRMVQLASTSPARLLELASVCRQWRDAILNHGPLWTDISIDSDTTDGQLSTQLRHSANCTLTVLLICSPLSDTPGRAIIQALMCERQRLGILRLAMDSSHESRGSASLWPVEISQVFTNGTTWPQLQILQILGDAESPEANANIDLWVVAPRLRDLDLSHVNVADWSHLAAFAPTLQTLDLNNVNFNPTLLKAITHLSALRSLRLAHYREDMFSLIMPIQLLSTSLRQLESLYFEALGLPLDIFMPMVCSFPLLRTLSVKVIRFLSTGTEQPDSDNVCFTQLQHVVLEVHRGDDYGMLAHIVRRLQPRNLVTVKLVGIKTLDFATITGPALETLSLTAACIEPNTFARALQQCPKLRALELTDVHFTADGDILDYSAMSNISSAALRPKWVRLTVAPPETVHNDRIVAFFLSLLPLPGIPVLRVTTTPLSFETLLSIMPKFDTLPQPLKLRFKTDVGPSIDLTDYEQGFARTFATESVLECVEFLHTQRRVFAHVTIITVDCDTAQDVLAARIDAFPVLEDFAIIVAHRQSSGPQDVEQALTTMVHRRSTAAPLDCPQLRLLRILKNNSSTYTGFPRALCDSFVGLFRSERSIELKLRNIILE